MRHPSAFTYDYAIRYHAREQALSDVRHIRRRANHASRVRRDKIPLKKRDIQIRSAAQSR